MSKILIVKTGNTVSSLRAAGEDFEQWFVQGCELEEGQYDVVEVFQGAALPAFEAYRGIIVTGSPAFVSDLEKWSEESAAYLRRAVESRVPVLGVCYGHQLLARAFGGVVDFHPRGREIGTVEVCLSDAGKADALLGGLPPRFAVQVSHSQSVTSLPDNAVLLAGNDFEPHHAFRVGESAWGLQFHPEFSERTVKAYIDERRDELQREQLNPDQLLSKVAPSPEAAGLLKLWADLVW